MSNIKHFSISKPTFVNLMSSWVFIFFILAGSGWNPFGLLYVLGIPFLLFLPGHLTLVVRNIRHLGVVQHIVLATSISVLELLLVGFLGNWLLPFVGVERPLDTAPLLIEILLLVGVQIFIAYKKFEEYTLTVPKYYIVNSLYDTFAVLSGLVFVGLSVVGALRLNDGAGNTPVMVLLLSLALCTMVLFRYSEKCSAFILPLVLYFMSLALLFMTSLRGWFISGHDIQREFFVFQLAKNAGIWSHTVYVDAYNACLSITILPTLFANLLHMPDVYIYKVLFQILFALVVVVVFLISRVWLSARLSFLAGVFFIAFSTFFQDMPFLARQEIAFLFFGVMLYVLFEEKISFRLRQILFVSMGVGVILSHYSTTYTVLFILALTSFTMFCRNILLRRGLIGAQKQIGMQKQRITLTMVSVLLVLSVVWTSGITKTDSHVKHVVQDVWVAIQDGFGSDSYSSDIMVLFTFSNNTEEKSLEDYVQTVVDEERAGDPDLYYATSTYYNYAFTPVQETTLPYTPLGTLFSVGAVSFGELVTSFGKVFAKVIQVAVFIGLLSVFTKQYWSKTFDTEFFILAVYSLMFVVLCIVVPLLSQEYGVFRAVQQAMFVLAPFMILGILSISNMTAWLVEQWYALFRIPKRTITKEYVFGIAGLVTALFLLFSTGFIPQLVGGNIPAVHLNNVGNDFDQYVIAKDEEVAIGWLAKRVEQDRHRNGGEVPLVQADRYGKKKLESVLGMSVSGDIFPGSIQKDAYVFVGPAITEGGVAVLSYESDILRYRYPLEFLEKNKEIVFSNKTVQIYR